MPTTTLYVKTDTGTMKQVDVTWDGQITTKSKGESRPFYRYLFEMTEQERRARINQLREYYATT